MRFLEMKNSRDFLQAALNGSSIRKLSRRLGYTSDRGIGMVLKGQRNMSAEMQARLTRALRLTAKENLHLQSLVRAERHPSEAPAPTPAKNISTTVTTEQLHPLAPAYALTVLELFRTSAKVLSLKDIGAKLREKVPAAQLRATLVAMADAGLVKQERAGFFRALRENEYIGSSFDIPSRVIRSIHKAQLLRAMETLEEQSTAEREFIAKTLTVAAARLPEIKRLIREKLEELAEEIAEAGATEDALVAQLNVQFYLQSRKVTQRS